jgi:hypothetical protein
MSHSKLGRIPVEEQVTQFRKWVVVCTACGRKGRSETYDRALLLVHSNWFDRFERAYEQMPLDELGRCSECSRIGV